jgi:hypothetical protein
MGGGCISCIPGLDCTALSMSDAFASVTFRPGPAGVSGIPGRRGRREGVSRKADAILDRLAAGIPGAAAGFTLLFSALPFPGADLECVWQREEFGGNWYHCPAFGLDGWLCPALFKYFETAPPRLYIRAQAKGT